MKTKIPTTAIVKTIDTSKLTIGSDPELSILDNDMHLVYASEIIHDEHYCNKFGVDGCGRIPELRPDPTSNPLTHVENIKRILYDAAQNPELTRVFKYTLKAGNTSSATGGHIHIGHPRIAQVSNQNTYYESNLKREKYIKALVASFDTTLVLPIAFCEDPKVANYRKCQGSYGKVGDFRTDKSYGIEYRTPPSWMASERLAKGVISTAYTIAWEVLEHEYDNSTVRDKEGYDYLYNHHQLDMLKHLLPGMIRDVRGMELYPTYKEHIDYLMGSALRGLNLFTPDIRKGWTIPYIHVRKAVLLSIQSLVAHIGDNIIGNNGTKPGDYTFILSTNADWIIPQIRDRVNTALNRALDKHYDADDTNALNKVYIYGKNKEAGDIITISYNSSVIPTRRITRMVRLINDTLMAFQYPGTLQIQAQGTRYGHRMDGNAAINIGIGRPLREFSKYAAEAVVFLCVLYANNAIYKAYRIHKKTGRKVTLPIITTSIIPGMRRLIATHKLIPETPEDEAKRRSAEEVIRQRIDNNELDYEEGQSQLRALQYQSTIAF